MTIDELLVTWLPSQRWYGAKGREVDRAGVRTLATLVEGDPEVCVHLVSLDFADGGHETYQVPLEYRTSAPDTLTHALVGELEDSGRTRLVFDCLHDKEVTGAWIDHIASGDTVGDVSFHTEPGRDPIPRDEASIVMLAEQSNTSLVYGTEMILKVFRKVSHGVNPDIEIHSALHRAGSPHIAPPLGWVGAQWAEDGGAPAEGSLAMLQRYLPSATQGWEMAKTSVRDLYAEADLHADEVGGDFAAEAARLGAATAEVHADLARTLATGVMGADDFAGLAHAMHTRLEEAAGLVPGLAERALPIRAAFDELAVQRAELPTQRIHGDYHLGQVLRTDHGWVLLDFEGEPARPLAERRALASPLKDVAGMLRSFDYAARHLLVLDHPNDPQLEYRASEWADRNRDAFCDGYAKAAGTDPRDADVVLRAFELDKVVYEVVYEARNRPSWLSIPLSALDRLAD
ncbi:MAG: maltokinase N-terminal cap-like domain-containing protein [Actinomycetes bacterium]